MTLPSSGGLSIAQILAETGDSFPSRLILWQVMASCITGRRENGRHVVFFDDNDAAPLWIGIVAFGRVADDLLRHGKGCLLSASGRVQRRTLTTQAGEKREQLQIVADAIVSARMVCASGGKRGGA